MSLDPEVREAISIDLLGGKTVRFIADFHGVSTRTVQRVRNGLKPIIGKEIKTVEVPHGTILKPEKVQREKPPKKAKTESKVIETVVPQEAEKSEDEPPRPGMVRGFNGKGWINAGKGLGGGNKGSIYKQAMTFLGSQCTEDQTWIEVLMQSLVLQAMAGSTEHMSMALTLVTKEMDNSAKVSTVEQQALPSSASSSDPLFDEMSESDLETQVYHLLHAKMTHGDDVVEVEALDA